MEHPVSNHAVVRYLERIHGFRLTDALPHAGDRYRAEVGAERLGMTVDDVRDLVCPPRLHAAIRMGLTGYVRAGDRTLPIRDGAVVTCLEATPNPRKRRQRAERERTAA